MPKKHPQPDRTFQKLQKLQGTCADCSWPLGGTYRLIKGVGYCGQCFTKRSKK